MNYYELDGSNTINIILGLIDIAKHNPKLQETRLPEGKKWEYEHTGEYLDDSSSNTGQYLFNTRLTTGLAPNYMTPTGVREILFHMEQAIEETYPLGDSIRTNWNSQYNVFNGEALFWNKQADRVLLATPSAPGEYVTTCYEYNYSDDIMNQIVENWMIREQNLSLSTDASVVVALKELWMIQSKSANAKKVNDRETLLKSYPDMEGFLRLLELVVRGSNGSTIRAGIRDVTFKNMVDFYLEVNAGELTQKSAPVQDWLTKIAGKGGLDDLLKVLVMHKNFKQVGSAITTAPVNEQLQIKDELWKDKRVANANLQVIDIFKVNIEPSESAKKKAHHVMGVHGTKVNSVPSILLNGLKTSTELADMSNVTYEYTGSGLGDGVYFAYTYQASKPLNYNGSDDSVRFLFIADLAYNTKKVFSSYGNYDDKADLVLGDKVGSHNVSELVMRHSEDVTIKYVVAVKKAGY